MCSPRQLECVNNVKVDTSKCTRPCSGLIVTSIVKTEENDDKYDTFYNLDYDNYKKTTQNPKIEGKKHNES